MHVNVGFAPRLLCWCVALVLSANAVFADAHPMLLTPQGDVKVNGAAVRQSTTVFAGDEIDTAKDSSSTLVMPGVQVTLAPDSVLVYGNNGPNLSRGLMLVSTTAGTGAQLGNLRVTPVKGKARFEMVSSQERMVLMALEGSLSVSDGQNEATLSQGEQMSHETAQPSTETGSAPGPARRVGLFRRHIPGWVIALIAAGAAGGIVAAIVTSGGERHRPISPSAP